MDDLQAEISRWQSRRVAILAVEQAPIDEAELEAELEADRRFAFDLVDGQQQ